VAESVTLPIRTKNPPLRELIALYRAWLMDDVANELGRPPALSPTEDERYIREWMQPSEFTPPTAAGHTDPLVSFFRSTVATVEDEPPRDASVAAPSDPADIEACVDEVTDD
jgi:hypothetical protein